MKHGQLDHLPEQPVSHNPDIKKRVLFKHGEIPSVTQFSQACFLPGQIAPAHSHADMYKSFSVSEEREALLSMGKRTT